MNADIVHLVNQQLTLIVYIGRRTDEKTKLFILVSNKLGRGASIPTSSDIISSINEIADMNFLKCMWRRLRTHKYPPLISVALVAIFLSVASPPIYAELSECGKSVWVAAIVCDILEALAINCSIIFTAPTVRELLCQLLLR